LDLNGQLPDEDVVEIDEDSRLSRNRLLLPFPLRLPQRRGSCDDRGGEQQGECESGKPAHEASLEERSDETTE
jgi:hypothetical protein